MEVIFNIKDMQKRAEELRLGGYRIACVPTMGALHEGHLSLIRLARKYADVVVMSNFVNPTQFAPNEDFTAYPRDAERDRRLAESAGCDIVFAPSDRDMYPKGFATTVQVAGLTAVLEGVSRPSHFAGVTLVVAKLFNIMKPHAAVFGQKDAQQVSIIKRMAGDLDFDVEIVTAPIVRDADGLALSSRNVYLSPEERVEALAIHRALMMVEKAVTDGERNAGLLRSMLADEITRTGFIVPDYAEIVDAGTLEPLSILPANGSVLAAVAARVGKTRLIDNSLIKLGDV
jgi:pantoate--beta-alanine ligase